MSNQVTVAGTTATSLGIVDANKSGLSVLVRAASDLDSGTITIGYRPAGDTGVIEALDATLVAGGSATYTIGEGMELFTTQSGAASSVVYLVSQYS
jgi:hypothetical protein